MCIYIHIFFFFLTSIHTLLLPTWPSITGWDWFYSVLLRVWAQCVKLKLQEQLSGPKQRHVSLTINAEVDVPLALPRSIDCHTRVCPRVTELGTGQCQHPAPGEDLQREHSTFRHTPESNTGSGSSWGSFQNETLVSPLLPTIPLLPTLFQCSLLIQTCKSRTITSCQSIGNSWHSQDFGGSGCPSLPPASNMLSHLLSVP